MGLFDWLIKGREHILPKISEDLKKLFMEFKDIAVLIGIKKKLLDDLKIGKITAEKFSEEIMKIVKEDSIKKGLELIKGLNKAINSGEYTSSMVLELEDIKADLTHDYLFVKIKQIFDKQIALVREGFDQSRINEFETLLLKEDELLKKASFIIEKNFAETHAHSVATIPLKWHWKAFKKYGPGVPWDLVINKNWRAMKTEGYPNYYISKVGKITPEIARQLKWIAERVGTGRLRESGLRRRFEEAITFKYDQKEGFGMFQNKVDVLGLIQFLVFYNSWKGDTITKMMLDTAKHQASKGISYLEFRSGITHIGEKDDDIRQELTLLLFTAKIVEEELRRQGKKMKIRILPSMYHFIFQLVPPERSYKPVVDKFLKIIFDVRKNNDKLWEYIGGIDYYEIGYVQKKEYVGQTFYIPRKVKRFNDNNPRKLYLTLHIGEMFEPKNFEDFKENKPRDHYLAFLCSLQSVSHAVKFSIRNNTIIKRLGHANVLGIDVNKYFERVMERLGVKLDEIVSEKELKDLNNMQKLIMSEMKKHNITTEANPTSNVRITEMEGYKDHPLKQFISQGMPVSINTDDASTFMTNLRNELLIMADKLKLDKGQIEKIIKAGFESVLGEIV